MIDISGAVVSWDYQIGTFRGQYGGVTVGNFGGDILSVAALEAALGVTLSGETGAQLQEAMLAAPYMANKRYVTKLEFMDLFRPADLQAIYNAAKVSAAVQIEIDRVDRAANDKIELTSPLTAAGLNALEAAGLLTVGDAARIILGHPRP